MTTCRHCHEGIFFVEGTGWRHLNAAHRFCEIQVAEPEED